MARNECGKALWLRPDGWSRVSVPTGLGSESVLAFLSRRFTQIPAQTWAARLAAGLVRDALGSPVAAELPVAGFSHLHYRRAVEDEQQIPFEAAVLYRDEHILVADKPHFLPVVPSGHYVEQTLQARLRRQLGLPQLAALHRLDKDTAGLVLFSCNPASSNAYHAMFRERRIDKEYEAVAAFDARFAQPVCHRSRLVAGGPRFFTMVEVEGPANSETCIVLEQPLPAAARAGSGAPRWARYRLRPVTGRKHQLRVHMAALGVPIRNDPFYPVMNEPGAQDYSRPLQLLARRLAFTDPLSGAQHRFVSRRQLCWPVPPPAAETQA